MTYRELATWAGFSGNPSMTVRNTITGFSGILNDGQSVLVTSGLVVNIVHTCNA
jgi:hypothetical protein